MKKIIYLVLVIVSIYLIYFEHSVKKYNYVSIGENIVNNYDYYVKDYLEKNNKLISFNNYYYSKSILNLIDDIKNNRTIRINNKEYYLKKLLRESDLLVVNIGMNSLSSNYSNIDVNKNYYLFNKLYQNYELLIKEIKKYAQGTIIFIGYYNPTNYYDSTTDEFFYHMNYKLLDLFSKNSIKYIDLYEVVKSNRYKLDKNTYSLNTYGNKYIAEAIEYYVE